MCCASHGWSIPYVYYSTKIKYRKMVMHSKPQETKKKKRIQKTKEQMFMMIAFTHRTRKYLFNFIYYLWRIFYLFYFLWVRPGRMCALCVCLCTLSVKDLFDGREKAKRRAHYAMTMMTGWALWAVSFSRTLECTAHTNSIADCACNPDLMWTKPREPQTHLADDDWWRSQSPTFPRMCVCAFRAQ